MDDPDLQQLIIKRLCDSLLSAGLYLFTTHCVLYLKKKRMFERIFFFLNLIFFLLHYLLTKRKSSTGGEDGARERVKALRSAACRTRTCVMTDALILCP